MIIFLLALGISIGTIDATQFPGARNRVAYKANSHVVHGFYTFPANRKNPCEYMYIKHHNPTLVTRYTVLSCNETSNRSARGTFTVSHFS